MRKFFLIVIFLPFLIQAQTNVQPGLRDGLRLYVYQADDIAQKDSVLLEINNNRKGTYELGSDAPLISEKKFNFTSITTDNFNVVRDMRPYIKDKYYVDYPLSLEKMVTGVNYKFTVKVRENSISESVVVFRIIDNEYPDKMIDLFGGDYSFTVKASAVKGRFTVRAYAACLFKKDASDKQWNNPANWWGGVPGKVGASEKINNCAIIPAFADVIIDSKEEFIIGSLLNSGTLTINQGGELTVLNEAQLNDFSETY